MEIISTSHPEVKIFKPKVFRDERGFFLESYNQKVLAQEAGIHAPFVQDNHSKSIKNVLRGLHYQIHHPQGKLVRVVSGEIYDVAVDIRKSSPFFSQWTAVHLSAEKPLMLWVPQGFAHGFLVLSAEADVLYKTTSFYDAPSEHCLRWDDPALGISWPLSSPPLLSAKDQRGCFLNEAALFP